MGAESGARDMPKVPAPMGAEWVPGAEWCRVPNGARDMVEIVLGTCQRVDPKSFGSVLDPEWDLISCLM